MAFALVPKVMALVASWRGGTEEPGENVRRVQNSAPDESHKITPGPQQFLWHGFANGLWLKEQVDTLHPVPQELLTIYAMAHREKFRIRKTNPDAVINFDDHLMPVDEIQTILDRDHTNKNYTLDHVLSAVAMLDPQVYYSFQSAIRNKVWWPDFWSTLDPVLVEKLRPAPIEPNLPDSHWMNVPDPYRNVFVGAREQFRTLVIPYVGHIQDELPPPVLQLGAN